MANRAYLDSLTPVLSHADPAKMVPRKSAAVAVIFLKAESREEVLLIRRAEREDDPWSGQVAFPGGMVSSEDETFEGTAKREAREEVGIDLSGPGTFLGYMKELKSTVRDVSVVPAVFKVSTPVDLSLNAEVASTFWVPMGSLGTEEARSTLLLERAGSKVAFPSLVYRDLVIWGLTERILSRILVIRR